MSTQTSHRRRNEIPEQVAVPTTHQPAGARQKMMIGWKGIRKQQVTMQGPGNTSKALLHSFRDIYILTQA